MSRTNRRTHFNKRNRSFFRSDYTSHQDVKRSNIEMIEKGYRQKDETFKFFSDNYIGVSKTVRQSYKKLSYRQLRQEFMIAEKFFISNQKNEVDILLEKVKVRCVKWQII